jgi:putative oxidoreductase
MAVDLALLILRVVIGAVLFGHGVQKVFGWFGGNGFTKTKGFMGSKLRLRPAGLWTFMAGASEAGGGLLFALGLLSPLGALGIIAAMLMATLLVHRQSFWSTKGGFEYPFVLAVAALVGAIAGPGAYSLDNLLGISLPEPLVLIGGLVLVLAGVGLALATREPASEAAKQQPKNNDRIQAA